MTDQEFTNWLDSDGARRVVLAELGVNSGGSETTRYIANQAFISAATDTPAGQFYEARLADGLVLQETLGIAGGTASISHSDIQINNADGGLDSWLLDAWHNRVITVYLGDASWPKADFRVVYAGVIDAVEGSGQDNLSVRVQDKMSRLDTAVTETKLGGGTPNADALIPLCFGECHNITPLLTNPATLEYAVHNGPIELIIEVRDNGVPVSFTSTPATGRFTLAAAPVGTITASVQGDKPSTYSNNVGALIQRLVKDYGRSDVRFTSSDLDTANFSAFVTANPQPVGLYLTDSTTVRDACNRLADSVGAKMVMTRAGLLRLVKIVLPPASTVAAISDSDIVIRSLQAELGLQIQAACKLGYCRNWTVQKDIQTGIPAQHKELYSQEWLTVTSSDSTAATLHKLPIDVEQEDSLLLVTADATTEAARRRALRAAVRTVFSFTTGPKLMQVALGDGLALTSDRYALSAGPSVLVTSLSIDWLGGTVRAEVLK